MLFDNWLCGGMPEWPKGADCKSAGNRLRGFKSSSLHHTIRPRSSGVERVLGKDKVMGSNPIVGSSPFRHRSADAGRRFDGTIPPYISASPTSRQRSLDARVICTPCSGPSVSRWRTTLTVAARRYPGEFGSTPEWSAIPPATLLGRNGQLTEFRRKEVQWRGKHSSGPSRT